MIQALTKIALLCLVALNLSAPSQAQDMRAVEATLCRSQLALLIDGDKLTAAERQRFEEQCDCLAGVPADGSRQERAACTQGEVGQ